MFIFFIICLFFGTCAVPSVADDNDQNSDESNINWGEQAKLLASDRAGYDRFGGSVSLDGNYVIIGAYQDNDNGNYSGSVYIFKRSDTIWTQDTKLLPSFYNHVF